MKYWKRIRSPTVVAIMIAVVALGTGCRETPQSGVAPTTAPEAAALRTEFKASPTNGQVPLMVNFTNTSKNADEFRWDFGDGATTTSSTTEEPVVHQYTKAGTHTVTLTAIKKGEPLESSTVTLTIIVTPGALDTVTIPPAIEVTAGGTEQLEAIATDQYGNRVSEVDVVWTVTDEDAGYVTQTGLFEASEVAGTFGDAVEVQVTQGDLVRTAMALVTVTPGPLEQVVIAPNPAEIGMEMTQQFVAVGADRYGNRISNLVFSWSVENGRGTIDGTGLFTAGATPGTYENTVEVKATQGSVTRSATANVTVEPDRILFISGPKLEGFISGPWLEETMWLERADIYIMDADGSHVRQLTDTAKIEGEFSCSPDVRRIVYDSGGRKSKIMVMSTDGSGKLCLSGDDTKTSNHNPAWSPDSSKIAFTKRDISEENSDIYVVDADGGNLTQLTDTIDRDESDPSWSPDGTRIVFSSCSHKEEQSDIYVMDADGGNLTQLTDTSQVNESSPEWSPDGTQIRYLVKGFIRVMNADGSNQKKLLIKAGSWSPDNTRITYASNYDIYVKNADGTDKRQFTESKDIVDAGPTWSPDGSKIVFVSGAYTPSCLDRFPPGWIQADSEILVMNADGSHKTCLTDNKDEDMRPQWLPRKRGVEVSEESVIIPKLR